MAAPIQLEAPVVIVGAGIMGCATAYFLARRGIRATVLERSSIGAEASGLNAGGVRAQCRDPRERKLAMASLALWHTLAGELELDVGYAVCGNLRLASTDVRMRALQVEAEAERNDGLRVEIWDQAKLRRQAPYLAKHYVGAKYCAGDGVADPKRATMAFAWAAQRLGATFITDTQVEEILVQNGAVGGVFARQGGERELVVASPQIVHAGGPWTAQLSKTVKVEIPLRPIRLSIGLTAPASKSTSPLFAPFLSDHELGLAARPGYNGQIYVSGFGEPEPTFDKQVSPASLADLYRIEQMVPALQGTPLVQVWSGLLDVTPDEVPIIDSISSLPGYLVAAGFSGHGFCLGPIIGQLLSEWILDGAPSLSLKAFGVSRFGDGSIWDENAGSSVIADKLTR